MTPLFICERHILDSGVLLWINLTGNINEKSIEKSVNYYGEDRC